ncbi:MAG: hypothetical protein IT327_27890 [Anaerolineae bacterium]|nr:hypothetical protein [Anaerolineae bacterium]
MKVKYALTLDAVVLLVVAVGCFFNMEWARQMFGIGFAPDNIYLSQLLGAAVFGLALQNWLVRSVENLEKLRIIILANFVGHGGAAVVLLAIKLSGLGDATAWLGIAYTIAAALVFGYFLDRPQIQTKHA